jgi:H+-transporting ATPase
MNIASTAVESKEINKGTLAHGLTQAEAERLLKEVGYNELVEKKVNPILKFFSYLWGPIPWMIEIAAILSGVARHWEDLGIILTLLIVNAVVGFWEEYQAGNAIAALKAKLALNAKVFRDRKWTSLPARELVPGDLIRVRLGDIVPADANLQETEPLEVDQSALTGESLPVIKKSGELLYSGSIVRQGEADAIVKGTGTNTYFGKTAELVKEAHTRSHFQRAVLQIGNYLIVMALVLVALILVVATMRGDPLLTTIEFALVLTIAGIPVAMPTVLTVTMAVGARALAAREAIVSRLAAIEELAGMDVLCSDKTGTLTQNKLTIGEPYCINGTQPEKLTLYAALASRMEDQDAIDLAVLNSIDKSKLNPYKVGHFMPFDPVHKRTQASVKGPEGEFEATKGAPQVILALSSNVEDVQHQVGKAVDEFAARGFRSLGVAGTGPDGKWMFLGILPLFDPLRTDSKATIETAKSMGINVKMVTGDQMAIGREIASQLNLGTNIVNADLFDTDDLPKHGQLDSAIESADGFAQVFPEHKFDIVSRLQEHGHIVGMTGDGVNDAPALKKADAGIAVSAATDAARAAADIALLTPGLSVIVDAIRESRKIFQRMNSYAIYRIAETIRVLLFMTLSILVFNFYPVTAVMIILLALLNDGAILSIAYDNAVASKKPESWQMNYVLGLATVLGVIGLVASFGLFYIGDRVFHLDHALLQTMIYLKLSVAGHLTIFLTRGKRHFWTKPYPAPILLGAVLGTQTIATLIAVYGLFMTPLGWGWALAVWAYAVAWFLVNDQVAVLTIRLIDRFNNRKRRMLTKVALES